MVCGTQRVANIFKQIFWLKLSQYREIDSEKRLSSENGGVKLPKFSEKYRRLAVSAGKFPFQEGRLIKANDTQIVNKH